MARFISIVFLMLMVATAQAASKVDLPTLDHPACAGAKPAAALVPVPIVRSCDKDHDGVNDCRDKNPYQCSLHCLGLSGVDLDANMRMPVDQGDGTCARSNLADALIWKGEVAPGNDRPGESYVDPRKPLPSGVLLFGAYHTRQFLVNTRIDYCDSALGDLMRCAQERDALQTKVAALDACQGQLFDPALNQCVARPVVAVATVMALLAQPPRVDQPVQPTTPSRQTMVLAAVSTLILLAIGFLIWHLWQQRDALQDKLDEMSGQLARQRQQFSNALHGAQTTLRVLQDKVSRALRRLGSAPDTDIATVAATRMDELSRAQAECAAQAARIVELTKQSRTESAPLLVTLAGELEAERGQSRMLANQLRDNDAELEDVVRERDLAVAALEVGSHQPPPCGHEKRIATLEEQVRTHDERVERLETIEAAHQRMKPHQPALEAWRRHMRQHSRSKAPVQVAGLAALDVVIAELEATPETAAA